MLNNIYQVVKNKFCKDNSSEELSEQTNTNNSPEILKSPKPDHTIVEIEKDFNQQSIDSPPPLTSSPKPVENQSNKPSPIAVVKKPPTKSVSATCDEEHIAEEPIMKPVFVVKEKEPQPQLQPQPQPQETTTQGLTAPRLNDIPRFLSFDDFAELTGIKTKLEDQYNKLVGNSSKKIQPEKLLDLQQRSFEEVIERYKEHYTHYERRCLKMGLAPVSFADAHGEEYNEPISRDDVRQCVSDMKQHLEKHRQQATSTPSTTTLNSQQQQLVPPSVQPSTQTHPKSSTAFSVSTTNTKTITTTPSNLPASPGTKSPVIQTTTSSHTQSPTTTTTTTQRQNVQQLLTNIKSPTTQQPSSSSTANPMQQLPTTTPKTTRKRNVQPSDVPRRRNAFCENAPPVTSQSAKPLKVRPPTPTPTPAAPNDTTGLTGRLASPSKTAAKIQGITSTRNPPSTSSKLTPPTTPVRPQLLRARRTPEAEKKSKRLDIKWNLPWNKTTPKNGPNPREITKAPAEPAPAVGSPFPKPHSPNTFKPKDITTNVPNQPIPTQNFVQNTVKPPSLAQGNLLQRPKMSQPKRNMDIPTINKESQKLYNEIKVQITISNEGNLQLLKEYEERSKRHNEEEYEMPDKSDTKPVCLKMKEGVVTYAKKENVFVNRKVTGIDKVKNPNIEADLLKSKSATDKAIAEKEKEKEEELERKNRIEIKKKRLEESSNRQKQFEEKLTAIKNQTSDMEKAYQQAKKDANSGLTQHLKTINKEIGGNRDGSTEEANPMRKTESTTDHKTTHARKESIDHEVENTKILEDIRREIDEMYQQLTSFSSSFYRSPKSLQQLKSTAAEITKGLELSSVQIPPPSPPPRPEEQEQKVRDETSSSEGSESSESEGESSESGIATDSSQSITETEAEESVEEEEEQVLFREVIEEEEQASDEIQHDFLSTFNHQRTDVVKADISDDSLPSGISIDFQYAIDTDATGDEPTIATINSEKKMKENQPMTKVDQLMKNLSKIKRDNELKKAQSEKSELVMETTDCDVKTTDQMVAGDTRASTSLVHQFKEPPKTLLSSGTRTIESDEEEVGDKKEEEIPVDLDPSNWPQLGNDQPKNVENSQRTTIINQIWGKLNDSTNLIDGGQNNIQEGEMDDDVQVRKLENPVRLDQPVKINQPLSKTTDNSPLNFTDKSVITKQSPVNNTSVITNNIKTEITEPVNLDDPSQWPQLMSNISEQPQSPKRTPTKNNKTGPATRTMKTPEKQQNNKKNGFTEASSWAYTCRPPSESPRRTTPTTTNNNNNDNRENYRRSSLENCGGDSIGERSPKTPPITPSKKDGPVVLYLTTKTNERSPNRDAKESPSKNMPSSKKSTPKIDKEKQPSKKESSYKDMLETFTDARGSEADHKERSEKILSMYQQSQPTLSTSSINKLQFKSCFQKASIINNSAKSLKNITSNEKVINCTIEIRRCLTNQKHPHNADLPKSERVGMLNMLKKSCKAINDRFKGHLCPLSFNDEFLQDLLKRGIIPKEDQHQDTTTSATYKSMCSRAVIMLNYIEHVRLIISSKKGDLKRMFSEVQFMLASIEEFLMTKNHSFLRDDLLGFVSSTNMGNAFNCFAEVTFECLEDTSVKDFLIKHGFKVGLVTYNKKLSSNVYRVDSLFQFDQSEVEILKTMKNILDALNKINQRFSEGQPFNDLLKLPPI